MAIEVLYGFILTTSVNALSLTIDRFKVENNSTASEWVSERQREGGNWECVCLDTMIGMQTTCSRGIYDLVGLNFKKAARSTTVDKLEIRLTMSTMSLLACLCSTRCCQCQLIISSSFVDDDPSNTLKRYVRNILYTRRSKYPPS